MELTSLQTLLHSAPCNIASWSDQTWTNNTYHWKRHFQHWPPHHRAEKQWNFSDWAILKAWTPQAQITPIEGGKKTKQNKTPNWMICSERKNAAFWHCPLETDTCYSPASPFLRALAEHELWCVSCDFSLFSLSKCSFGNLLFWNCFISSPLVSVKWKEAHQLNGQIFITVCFLQSC